MSACCQKTGKRQGTVPENGAIDCDSIGLVRGLTRKIRSGILAERPFLLLQVGSEHVGELVQDVGPGEEIRCCLAAVEAAATAALQILLLLQLCCFPTNNLYLRGVKPAIPCSWSRGRWRRWRCDHLKTEHNVVGMHRTLIETYYQLLNHTMSRHNSPWSASFEGQKAS